MDNYLKLPFDCLYVDDITVFVNDKGHVMSFDGALAFCFCTSGSLRITTGEKEFVISRSETFFLLPTLSFTVLEVSDDFACYVLRADYDYYFQIMDGILDVRTQIQMSQHPYVALTEQQFNTLLPLLKTLHGRIELASRNTLPAREHALTRKLIISMVNTIAYELLHIYMDHMLDQVGTVELSRKEQITQDFIILVFQNYDQEREIAYYADKLCLTPHYLSSVIKQTTGANASELIRERVVSEAKRLLAGTSLSAKEIAARLNFANQSFFGRWFKRYAGVSPQRYRSGLVSGSGAAGAGAAEG